MVMAADGLPGADNPMANKGTANVGVGTQRIQKLAPGAWKSNVKAKPMHMRGVPPKHVNNFNTDATASIL